MSVEIGQTISHYTITEKLGEGGMGVVYKAHDTSLHRDVALKFIPTHLTSDKSVRKRFLTEARAASALDHPNICTIHEIGETEDGQLFICMAYYGGQSLSGRIKQAPLQMDDAMHLFLQIAEGLRAAHEKNIMHRDIKPANILITEKDEVKIVDFGLARLAGEKLTESFSTKGTIAYMAPEIIRGLPGDHRSDIWSLGVVLYEMLTGHLPFRGDFPEPMMYSIVNEEPAALSVYLKDVPEALQQITDKLLRKDPGGRYQDLNGLMTDLEPLFKTTGLSAVRPKTDFAGLLRRKRNLLFAAVAVIIVMVALLIPTITGRKQVNTIAVLPLKNFSGDTNQEWFCEGMTDQLYTSLSQISGLTVKSQNSAMQYAGTTKSTQQIAMELGARYLAEGSAMIAGNRIKITIRLIRTAADEYIWAREYEREYRDILNLQGEIARTIAGQIGIRMSRQEEKLLTPSRTVNPETYELYTKGIKYINQRTEEGIAKGLEYLHQAAATDPEEPLAHAGLAIAYCDIAHTPKPTADAPNNAKAAALKALELDEDLAEVHLALAMIKIYFDMDKKGAGKSYRRVFELNRNIPRACMHYGYYLFMMGDFDTAKKMMQRAIELDPLSNIYPAEFGWMSYFMGDFDTTIKLARRSLELVPDDPFALFILGSGYQGKRMYEQAIEVQKRSAELSPYHEFGLGYTYALAGYRDKALEIAHKLEQRSGIWDTINLAVINAALGDADKTFYWLEKAYEVKHPYIQWMRRNTYYDAYKNDPRYISLVERMNLP